MRSSLLSSTTIVVLFATACSGSGGGGSPGLDPVGTDTSVAGDGGSDAPRSDAASVDALDAPDGAVASDAPGCVSGLAQPNAACQACQDANCCILASDCAKTGSKWSCAAATICRASDCQAECEVPAPTCGDILPDPVSCTAATRAACCPQLSACAKSEQCLAMIYICIDEHACDPSKPCFAKCRADWPEGSKVFDVVDKCYSTVSCP